MSRVPIFLLIALAAACRPTYEDYDREATVAFHAFMTGNVQTAKAALLEHEKIIANHEARGNRGINYQGVRLVLYGNLFGICDYMGQTNEAKIYLQKYIKNLDDKQMTCEELATRAKKHHDNFKPKWREPNNQPTTN